MEACTTLRECGGPPNPYKETTANIIFLSASSGGGHHAVAESLSLLISNVQESTCHTIDLYADPRLKLFPKVARIRAKLPWAWAGLLRCTDNPRSIGALWKMFRPGFTRSLQRQIASVHTGQPDIIIATHHASAQCLSHVAKSYAPAVPKTVVFVTDYDAHQNWIACADLYVVASDKAFERLANQGMNVIKAPLLPCTTFLDQLNAHAPVLSAGHRTAVSTCKVNKHHEMFKLVAIMGLDGTSERKLKRLLKELDKQSFAHQLTIDVICGKNRHLHEQLLHSHWDRLQVRVHGFVKDVPQRLADADLALLRLSPQIMTESLVAKTPIIAFDWHSHERENIRLLRGFGAGEGARDYKRQVHLIERFCLNAALRNDWKEAVKDVSEQRIANEFIEQLLDSLKKLKAAPREVANGKPVVASVSSGAGRG